MKLFNNFFKTIALLAIVFACNDNSENSQEEDKQELHILKNEIEQLVAGGICSEDLGCDFIAFGSKTCGGPWTYLLYSKSINVSLLKEKITVYNEKETAYNIKWNVISNCMAEVPPSKVKCIDGVCTSVY